MANTNANPDPRTSRVSGDSTDAFTVVENVPLIVGDQVSHRRLGMIIKNTGLVNSISVKIVSRIFPNAVLEYEELAETGLTAGSLIRYFENDLMGSVDIYIKSTVPGAPSSYSIEWAISEPRD